MDHSFVNPSVQIATLAYEDDEGGQRQATFGILAEEENLRLAAKICFISYMAGPCVPVKIGRGHNPFT